MKKWLILFVSLLSCLTLMACGNNTTTSTGQKQEVTLWGNGSDNVKMAMESIANAFNESEYGDKYTLSINWITSGTGAQSLRDRILAATKAEQKNTDYDLILVSDSEYSAYLAEGGEDIFIPVDFDKVPNSKNLKASVSMGEDYLIPYRGTTVVLAYDSAAVANPPKTTEELYKWIKDNPGRFSYNPPGSGGAGGSFVTTSIYNFLPKEALTSTDAKWKAEWDKGFDLLKELHQYMYKSGGQVIYPNKNQGTLDLLANKEVDMIPAWADMAIQQLGQGTLPDTVKITQLNPAFTGEVDAMAMPAIGSDQEGAQAVMNFMLSEKAQGILLDQMAAIPLIDNSNLDSPNSKYLEGLSVSSFRGASLGTLSSELYQRWDEEIATLK